VEQKIKWGIIAAGGIARRRTLPAIHLVKNAEVIGIMDSNTSLLEDIAKEYHIPNCYDSAEALLENEEIDAVYVASPVCFHKEHAIKTLQAGKHLLLEKPIGLDLEEAKEIMEIAEQSDRKVGIAMIMRFHQGHREMKKIIENGGLGDIVSCRAQLTCWFPDMENNWRQHWKTGGGGALVDMGVHCIDLLRFLLDDDVDRVYGEIGTRTFQYEVDDSADCLLHMKKGASCYVDVHFNIPDEAANGMLEIYGTKGSFIANGTIGQDGKGEIKFTAVSGQEGYNSQQVRDTGMGAKDFVYEFKNPYAQQITEFSDAILNDGPVSTPLRHVFKTMQIVDALYKSAADKKVCEI